MNQLDKLVVEFTLRRTHPVDAHGGKSPGERDLTGETLTEESLTKKTLIGQALTERIHTN